MIKTISGILVIVGIFFGAYFYIDSWKADAESMQMLRNDYEAYKLEQRQDKIQERIWTLEDRYEGKRMPESVIEEYRDLKVERQNNNKKLEKYYKGK